MLEQEKILLKEQMVEIRYAHNPSIFDRRAQWVKSISVHMDTPLWKIGDARVDVFSQDSNQHYFVSIENAGVTIQDATPDQYFHDKAAKFFALLYRLDGFENEPIINRIGVRGKFCKPFMGSFEELKNIYCERYLNLRFNTSEAFGNDTEIVDIGGPINFKDKLGFFNTMSGPMTKAQFSQFFSFGRDYPEVGMYYDIDYWTLPEKGIGIKELTRNIRDFAKALWSRYEIIAQIIPGGEY